MRIFLLFLLLPLLSACSSTPPSRLHFQVYEGTVPTIDGTIEEGEWDDAYSSTAPGLRVWLKHDKTYFYFAVKHTPAPEFNCIDLIVQFTRKKILNFHASAQLGEEDLELRGAKWISLGFPGWQLTNTDAKKKQFEETYKWFSAVDEDSTKGHFEFRVSLAKLGIDTSFRQIRTARVGVAVTNFQGAGREPNRFFWPVQAKFIKPGSMVKAAKVIPTAWAHLTFKTGKTDEKKDE